MSSLAERAVERELLPSGDGKSGSRLERWRLDDGTTVVVKTISPEWDWIMRATRDEGRIDVLWQSGVLDLVPPAIDHGILLVERVGHECSVVMRDLSATLLPDDYVLSRAQSQCIVRAAAELHEAFFDREVPELCQLEDLYSLLSPTGTAAQDADAGTVTQFFGRGWERFHELVPGDVSEAIAAILDRPASLATELAKRPATLIHGDLKLSNLGLDGERVVVVDWGTQTTVAPPAVEYAWYIAINASRIDASHDELLEDVRHAGRHRHDEDALRLALLGALVQLGWDKALQATEAPDRLVRDREREDLGWWVARAREALDTWTPG